MRRAKSTTALRGTRNSDSFIQQTIADAIVDSKHQFTDCYRGSTIGAMTNKSVHVAELRRLVEKAGGPADFARTYSKDDADKPIDPTYISQILNGHRPFGDKARRNMALRAGLPPNYFEIFHKVEAIVATYEIASPIIDEAVAILKTMPRQRQL